MRSLIEQKRIPDDVTIQVLTHARADLIERTFEALSGVPRAIVHQVNAVSEQFRRIVFTQDKESIKQIAVNGTLAIRRLARAHPETEWRFEYSPEMFSDTELSSTREVCDAVAAAWQPGPGRKMILNRPAGVEASTPNVYADQIEWMHRNLAWRDSIVMSVHPHNDRGSAVVAAELALLAGAERIEGCLFGHGERTGNVDLITLALKLYSQGVDPELDFSDIDTIRREVETATAIAVHPLEFGRTVQRAAEAAGGWRLAASLPQRRFAAFLNGLTVQTRGRAATAEASLKTNQRQPTPRRMMPFI